MGRSLDEQTGVRRLQQQELTALTNVGSEAANTVFACAVSPCELAGVCLHSGVCSPGEAVEQATSFTCDCPPGYDGGRCETDVDECSSTPCQNGGHCAEDGLDAYSCTCGDTGFDGGNCADDVMECDSSPCDHAGACAESTTDATVDVGTYYCSCAAGYSGFNCDGDVNECASAPCQNGGQCSDGVNGYSCACEVVSTDRPRLRYAGERCEICISDYPASQCCSTCQYLCDSTSSPIIDSYWKADHCADGNAGCGSWSAEGPCDTCC